MLINQEFVICTQTGVLVEELNRISSENKKLTEMLTVLCENYNALHNQFAELMSKNSEKELPTSRKRKTEHEEDNSNMIGLNANTESSSSEEESNKRPKESFKTKISRAYYRTNESNTSLVSSLINMFPLEVN